jgi:hypothetical protein
MRVVALEVEVRLMLIERWLNVEADEGDALQATRLTPDPVFVAAIDFVLVRHSDPLILLVVMEALELVA